MVRPTAVSSAWRVIPAASPRSKEIPCARKAIAIAALAIPMFPGVSGMRPETSSAGRMSRAATSGRWIPIAALIAAAPAKRPRTEKRTQRGQARDGRAARGAGVPASEDGGRGDERRLRRATATTGRRRTTAPASDEGAKDCRAGGRDGDERASRRPDLALAGDEPREEREPDGVAGAGRDEGVDERAGAVAGGRVGERRPPAAEPDGRAPAAGRADERDGERDARRARASAGRRARAFRARSLPANRGSGASPPQRRARTAGAPLRRGCSC